jgi:RNase H-like domain found in reverse transcriptase/Integrase zinc binding domain
LKLAKFTFGKTEVKLLGQKVRFGEVRPNDRHRDCLQRFEEPTNVTELLRFLGLLQFFGAHVDHLAELAAPLHAVLEGTQWSERKRKREIIRLADWEQRSVQAQKELFEKLRDVLADPLFLVSARANAKKRLCTDASKHGLGAALLQWEEERGWLPVGFASRKLKGAEPSYTTMEKENLAAVFGLRKFRHCLDGEKFEVITDHIGLTWLLTLWDPKRRLARWIVEMQTYDFDVLYERGDKELMAVPDSLSRDAMDKDIVLCHRCLEAVDAVSEDRSRMEEETRREFYESESREKDVVTVAEMVAAHAEAYGDGAALLRNENRLRDEDGLICQVFGKGNVRVLVPPALRSKVLKLVHGNRLVRHWEILRTAAMVSCRYYWPGWASDVRKAVSECLACELGRLRRPGVQAQMMRYHPSRRFQMVAMDVLEISPESKRGNQKVLVIGNMFSRYIVAVPISDESPDTMARVFFDR